MNGESFALRDAETGDLALEVPGLLTQWPWLVRLRDADERNDYKTEGWPGADAFGQARAYARWLSGKLRTTIRVYDDDGRYVVTCCGGTDYWQADDGGQLHQIGSDGWCWNCFQDDRGFIRHPVTPAEVREPGWLEALPRIHERGHPPCDACGLGYTRPAMMAAVLARLAEIDPEDGDNTPLDGGEYALEYVPHGPRCAHTSAGPEHKAMGPGEFCAGCAGTCCTGDPDAGPCTCTEESRLAYFERNRP